MIIQANITKLDLINKVIYCGINWIGLNFCKENPNYLPLHNSIAGVIPDYSSITEAENGKNSNSLNIHKKAQLVGIFKDDMPQTIISNIVIFNLNIIELLGKESKVMIENLRSSVIPDIVKKIKIVKQINISKIEDFEQCHEYNSVVDYFLFNISENIQPINELIKQYKLNIPFILSIKNEKLLDKKIVHHMLCGFNYNYNINKSLVNKNMSNYL